MHHGAPSGAQSLGAMAAVCIASDDGTDAVGAGGSQ